MTIGITLTGADERTPIPELQQLVEEHSALEIGLLYTETPDCRNRYPRIDWLLHAAYSLKGRCSVHVCGRLARSNMLLRCEPVRTIVRSVQRFQINGRVGRYWVETVCEDYSDSTVITQYNSANKDLLNVTSSNHCMLIDGSGGRGESPSSWIKPDTTKAIGFAGGLGPDNLAIEFPKIAAVATGNWWIDLESNLRANDWFDLDKAKRCLEIFEGFIK